MTTPPNFPILPGQGWSVHKRPTFSTRIASHVSGREVRQSLYAYTLYEFELTFNGLDSNGNFPNLMARSLQRLMGLYLSVQGQFGTFLYTDPTDSVASAQGLGEGDGTTTSFTVLRSLGGWGEPVGWVTDMTAVYLNGVVQSASGWSVTEPNTLNFATAPASGDLITADFTYAFVCRFLADQEDFDNFMSGLWKVDSLKFRSVKP
ncbi:DUF2460 domain-containing protein [Methylovirgula sp. HY1]|uniref:DUF2460 domain-containing protein n=1 Tax=Methylovirgula sp. HY1 TaxID=2822761 RepID=UPI001C5B6B38|nr:DUF2460 domain-containing protein [Methylovirgula sp. HY1]QXX74233.1 hypothetical protein MHY1_01043 [Methylovirgula sp. HY1]